nr:metabolite traffic protein EboE [Pelagicoccus albus]
MLMQLANGAHLAYCTNVHPGNNWEETFRSLKNEVLQVKACVCPHNEYAIGLRLSALAAKELSQPKKLAAFKAWLNKKNCYVFTINGFPYGNFHGERVKEQVYRPDWSEEDRLTYTNLLFDILVQLLPTGVAGSVSTLPGSFKRFVTHNSQYAAMHDNLYKAYQHIETLSETYDLDLHLGLEPEPLGLFENTEETITFFEHFLNRRKDADQIKRRIGVNYDTCHLALEYEDANTALRKFDSLGIRISKLHISSALVTRDFSPASLELLSGYNEPTYLHQVLAKEPGEGDTGENIRRYEDLPAALKAREIGEDNSTEWRIHFHIPLHSEPAWPLSSTRSHIRGALDYLKAKPEACQHLEMETYTWSVLPELGRNKSVVEQITSEYEWALSELNSRSMLV